MKLFFSETSPKSRDNAVRARKIRGSALVTVLLALAVLSIASAAFIGGATGTVRMAHRQVLALQTAHLCESAAQSEMMSFWTAFKSSQTFTAMDAQCNGASISTPMASTTGTIPNVGKFSGAVIAYTSPDTYNRKMTIRCVGWVDTNNNNVLDTTEPRRIVDVTAQFELTRSQVFDYTYFINNYGWMDGFGPNDLYVNGDMRANGNFSITNGSPTINGSLIACLNQKLSPSAPGLINTPPVKWDNSTYATNAATQPRWRLPYTTAVQGAKGSTTYATWGPLAFDTAASINNGLLTGAALADSTGSKSWVLTAAGNTPTTSLIDTAPTEEVIMPDLSNLSTYQALSGAYTDPKATFADGTTNPNYGNPAVLQVWDPSQNGGSGGYRTITSHGVIVGSASLVGTSAHPIIIHGPVTLTQDAVIKGYVSGQGTIYTGRNIHIVGSVKYTNPPDFRGTNMQTIDNLNEHKDMLGLAARGSIIMGDTSQFTTSYPLQYMTPPFTHPRYDDNGNLIPAYDATQMDSTGFKKYQSVMGDTYIHSIAEGVNQIDAIMYTNFVGGGDIGTGGGGVQLNGSIISKDESMVVFSLPMYMNYDNRIRERAMNNKPLIDLQLPRSPVLLRNTEQDRGFTMTSPTY